MKTVFSMRSISELLTVSQDGSPDSRRTETPRLSAASYHKRCSGATGPFCQKPFYSDNRGVEPRSALGFQLLSRRALHSHSPMNIANPLACSSSERADKAG